MALLYMICALVQLSSAMRIIKCLYAAGAPGVEQYMRFARLREHTGGTI